MSSSIWTPGALSSNARRSKGRCWRLVEAQHHVSTAKLTDTANEQDRLEQLIEASKPPVPEECRHLHYLLWTPFRYGVYPNGSRFRRAGLTLGVFYAAQVVETAAIEMAFHRLLFFAESPATPWPTNAGEYTAFAVEYATPRAIDLSKPPLSAHRRAWTHPTRYDECQNLADAARAEAVDIIKYQSVRDPDHRTNVAILQCRAFAKPQAVDRQTWRIHMSPSGARLIREFPRQILDCDRNAFAADPRIASMRWDRQAG
jgi:hypothetical protein